MDPDVGDRVGLVPVGVDLVYLEDTWVEGALGHLSLLAVVDGELNLGDRCLQLLPPGVWAVVKPNTHLVSLTNCSGGDRPVLLEAA